MGSDPSPPAPQKLQPVFGGVDTPPETSTTPTKSRLVSNEQIPSEKKLDGDEQIEESQKTVVEIGAEKNNVVDDPTIGVVADASDRVGFTECTINVDDLPDHTTSGSGTNSGSDSDSDSSMLDDGRMIFNLAEYLPSRCILKIWSSCQREIIFLFI